MVRFNPSLVWKEVTELERVVGEMLPFAYAPPNIYPMSVPAFQPASGVERPVARCDSLGVYVHIPFCNYKCSFCFYVTRIAKTEAEMVRYVDSLERELEQIQQGTRLTQLYIGGGTPTVLLPELLDRVLHAVFSHVDYSGSEVHTVECSPESVSAEHIMVLKKHGVQRVSMGVQSLDTPVLGLVKRDHMKVDPLSVCRMLLNAGMMVNVDLIYGLPGQHMAGFGESFEKLAACGVHSVTAYNLRVNEHTPVARILSTAERLDLKSLIGWRSFIRSLAEARRFEQTRWHTFRNKHPRCAAATASRFRDVTGQGDQFGVGVSARSRFSGTVYRNHRHTGIYRNRIDRLLSPVEEIFRLDERDQRLRYIALTLGDGSPLIRAEYTARFGSNFDDDFRSPLQRLIDAGLVENDSFEFRLSDRGSLVYDLVMRAFYPRDVRDWLHQRRVCVSSSANLSKIFGNTATE